MWERSPFFIPSVEQLSLRRRGKRDGDEMEEDSEGHILHSQAAFSYLLLFILYSHPAVETAFTFPPHLFFVCLFTFSFVAAVCGQNCNNLNPVGNLTYLF